MKHQLILLVFVFIFLRSARTAKANPKQVDKYTPPADQTFWSPGGHVFRQGDYSDPDKNPDFKQFYHDMTKLWRNINWEDVHLYEQDQQLVKMLVDEWGLRFTYIRNYHHVSWVFIAYADTQRGDNIPPVLKDGCDMASCSDKNLSWEWRSYYPVEDLINFHKPTEIQERFDSFLKQFKTLEDTFSSSEDVKDTICVGVPIFKDTLSVQISSLDKESAAFMDSPGTYGRVSSNKYLKMQHDVVFAKLLRGLIESMCNTPVTEEEVEVNQTYLWE